MHNQKGFTLVELMVTLLVMTIVTTIAFPNMKNAVRSYQLTSKANVIVNVLNRARGEAAKRGLRVTICSSTNGTSCAAANKNNWHQGWIVFVDADDDVAVSSGEEIIQYVPADSEYTLVLAGTTNYLSFVSSGIPKTAGYSWWAGNITVRRVNDLATDPARQVVISRAGNVSVQSI